MNPQTIEIDFPKAAHFLLTKKSRYKVVYGGRGSAKSWSVARALVLIALKSKKRILCARDIQNSIADSSHQLLSDMIHLMGFTDYFKIQEKSIVCLATGSEFIFAGLRYGIDSVRSKEGFNIVWVEEAHSVLKKSWDVLIPTIRKDESEIWVTFNPELETDETYQRLVKNPPKNSIVVKMNYNENPYFPKVLQDEMEDLKARDYDAYLNVWEGYCKQTLDGAIYASELRAALQDKRILPIPYNPACPVHTFWDLGHADHTSILFVQAIGYEFRIINHLSNRQKPLHWYLKEIQQFDYIFGDFWLPHDGTHQTLGTGKSIAEMMREVGHKVRIVPKLSIEEGINAARTVFPKTFIDEKCEGLLQSLRSYRYKVDDTGNVSPKPLHDVYSHDCDAFRYMAIGLKEPLKAKTEFKYVKRNVL